MMTTMTGMLSATLAAAAALAQVDESTNPQAQTRVIDLAICLDTSGSMEGLIDAARQKLWAIVNDLALARPSPTLRVALLTFGNDGHDAAQGWVAVQTPFTEDLDLVSRSLFALTTNGGTEYVGRVLQGASKLDWHPAPQTLRLVVVAGNESAEQDQEVPFPDVCRSLIARGIIVNSVYCGPAEDDLAPAWKQVALLADGQFATIDQNTGTVVVATPFDARLGELSTSLNSTYLPFGTRGVEAQQNQWAQDANASGLNSATAAQRCSTKASVLYRCGDWDLVDASRSSDFNLTTIATEDLPEAMRAMSPQERLAHVQEMGRQREALQKEIQEISRQREAFVQQAMQQEMLDDSQAFDHAIRTAIREQAMAKGFAW